MKNIHSILTGLLLLGLCYSGKAQKLELNLNEAIDLAKKNNKALMVQKLENELAEQTIKESKGYLLPTISAGGSYTYFIDRAVIFMPGSFVGSESPVEDVAVGGRNAWNAAINLNQPIFSEVARRQIKSAKLNALVEKEQSKDMETILVLDVAKTYYEILLIEETILLHRQSLERNIYALKDAKQLYEQGKGLKIDTVRSAIATDNLKADIAYLENLYQIALIQFKHKLGFSDQHDLVLTDRLVSENEVNFQIEEQVNNRPDLKQQYWFVELSKNGLEKSQSQRLPVLSLVGSYQLQAQADDLSFSKYSWPTTTYVGMQLNVPVFNGGRTNHQTTQAKLKLQQAKTALQDLEEKVAIEVQSIQVRLQGAKDRMDMHNRTLHAAELHYTMVKQRYQEGLSSRLEFTDAELALSEAKLSVLQSAYEVNISRLGLQKAVGLL